uniref:Protein kinase domain-containing protein n=1 Tax=Meloidogyne javanica TaxID=6303 RepID=A0A915MSL4_MELJA
MSHGSQINLKLNSQNINNDTLNNQQKSSLNANKNQENTNRSHELLPNILPRRRLSWAVTEKRTIQEEKLERQTNSEDTTNLRNDLIRLMIGEDKLLKVKVQYLEERTALNLQYPIRNQQDLDYVIQLHEKAGSKRRLRLILSQKRDNYSENSGPPLTPHSPISCGVFTVPNGIAETTLSETSSLWSLISSSSTKRTPGGTPIRFCGKRGETSSLDAEGLSDTPTPRVPNNWREGRCLGRGAYGHVFVCLDVDTGEQLVVKKIYLRGHQQRSRVMATLENELNMLGTLKHPNIVQYVGIISEYGALSEQMSILFTSQILAGLAYLHSKDIVHRDIKPANILRHTSARVKIGDFGSAKFLQAICSEQGIDIQGTPHYTAPEIIRCDRRYEPKSDVWSVGITLVEMLTTQTPWAGIEPFAIHVRTMPEPSLPNGLSLALIEAINLMLKRKLEERPTALELLGIKPFCSSDDERLDVVEEAKEGRGVILKIGHNG